MKRAALLANLAALLAPSVALACPYSACDTGSAGGAYLLAFVVGAVAGLGSLALDRRF